MASTYSPSLKIELMGTGDQTGTWGTTTNNNFLYALEEGLLGYINISFASDANKTLTLTDSNAAQDARNLYLYVTSGVSLTATRDLIVPTTEKPYIVHNATTGAQSIRVKTAAGTGITIPTGKKVILYADGTNVVTQFDYAESLTLVTPVLGTPTSGTLTNCTGLPIVAGTTGTLSVARGGTGVTTSTGTGNVVLSTSPTLTTPVISSIVNTGTLTLPTSTDTLVGRATTDTLTNKTINLTSNTLTATSAQLATAVSDETGSGALVFATSPTLVTPILGTPQSGTLTSCTGLPIVAGTTGTLSVARGGTGITAFGTGVATALGVNVGSSGAFVVNGGALGTPSSGTLTSCTGLPIDGGTTGTLPVARGGTGITAFGTGVATALGVNVGSSGAFVVNGGALGTPSSGTLTSCTGLPIVAGTTGTLSVARGGTGITAFGTGVATALGVNVGSSGAFVVNGGALGTPSSGTLTSCTGLPVSGVSGLGTGVATALAVNVGSSGAFVVNGGALGTPSSGTLTSCTGLPISTGVSGLGTGVATALAVNVGSAGAFVVNGGALGTPSSGTLTSCTGLPIDGGTTGTLPVARGGTGVTTSTGSGNVVLSTSPTFDGTVNFYGTVTGFAPAGSGGIEIGSTNGSEGDYVTYLDFHDGGTSDFAARILVGGSTSSGGDGYVDIEAASFNVYGNLTKSSGSFKIPHPLQSKTDTHYLVHSFIEGPKADLIYRGNVTLQNGLATINLDAASKMSEGTFEELCRDVDCYVTNKTGWDLVRGYVLGNKLFIQSQNVTSADTVTWLVIGERQDKHMYDTSWTDEDGHVIVEPEKLA